MTTLKKTLSHFKNINPTLLVVLFFIAFCAIYLFLKTFIYPPTRNEISFTNNNYNILGLNIPSNLSFCGEKIPFNTYEIKINLEQEFFNNAYWKANSSVLFSKAQKWFPYLESILKKEGVPEDFKYVALIESHLSNIVSPAGAAGFWQLIPASAQNYGLEVNNYVDERYHVEKATKAACMHFKEAYSVFKNWTLSAAAYNLGIGGIQAALKKQNANSYYELLLNKETGSFVYRILAYKTLFESPSHFGVKKKKWNYLPLIQFKTYKIDSSITNLTAFAKHIGCNKVTIRFFNPWLLQDILPNPDKKIYEIRIPKNLKYDYSSYIKDLIGEDGVLESDSQAAHQKADTILDDVSVNKKTLFHIVKDKDNIRELSEFYEVKEENLRKWNNIKDKQEAVIGQTLSVFYFK